MNTETRSQKQKGRAKKGKQSTRKQVGVNCKENNLTHSIKKKNEDTCRRIKGTFSNISQDRHTYTKTH